MTDHAGDIRPMPDPYRAPAHDAGAVLDAIHSWCGLSSECAWDDMCDVHRLLVAFVAVFGLHRRAEAFGPDGPYPVCDYCGNDYPCLTVAAITEALTRKEEV